MENTITAELYHCSSPIFLLDENLRVVEGRSMTHYELEASDASKPYCDLFFEFLYEPEYGFVHQTCYKKFTTDHPGTIVSHWPLNQLFLQIDKKSYHSQFEDLLAYIPSMYHEIALATWKSGIVKKSTEGMDMDRENTVLSYGKLENNTFHVIMTDVISSIDEHLFAQEDEQNE